jgi:hypothetical protein
LNYDGTGTAGSHEYPNEPDFNDMTVNVKATPLTINALTMTANGDGPQLPHNQNITPGVFVPVNDENDAANGFPENDLLPFTVTNPNPKENATFIFSIPDGIKIWAGPDPATARRITNDDPATLAVQEYWIEGTAIGVGTLQVSWTGGGAEAVTDSLKVTTFDFIGPQNVPDQAIYSYTATGALPGGNSTKWLEATGGDTKNTFYGNNGQTPEADILWTAGGTVGAAVLQASPDYVWSFDVNIVKVTIQRTNVAISNLQPETKTVNVMPGKGPSFYAISNNGLVDGYSYWTVDLAFTGPNNGRGVNHLQAGFIQTISENGVATYAQQKTRVLSISGTTFRDNASDQAPYPWIGNNSFAGPGIVTPVENGGGVSINSSDKPSLTVNQGYDGQVWSGNGGGLVSATLTLALQTYAAVRTMDSANGADAVYNDLAYNDWGVDFSGQVSTSGVYHTFADQPTISPTGAFTLVHDGSRVAIPGGPVYNVAIASATWDAT